jgi:hypothetical protein
MRQVSFTYGLHGIGMLLIASDVRRYRPLVLLGGIGYLAYGAVCLLTDIGLGMPPMWVAGYVGSTIVIGALVLGLLWADRRSKNPEN